MLENVLHMILLWGGAHTMPIKRYVFHCALDHPLFSKIYVIERSAQPFTERIYRWKIQFLSAEYG